MKTFRYGASLVAGVLLATVVSAQAADVQAGRQKAAMCAGCHGSDGQGSSNGIGVTEEYPNLAGQKQAYLLKQLQAFKAGTRRNPTMAAMVAGLSPADMENLAAYFASLTPGTCEESAPVAADQASAREFPEPVYVSMKKSGTVEVFPSRKSWQGGPNMLYDAVTPDGKRLLVTSPSSGKVHVFDTRSGRQLAVLAVGKAPKGVKISPDGKWAYVSNQGSASLSVVDLDKLQVVGSIAVKEGPHNARFTRDGRLAYVTLQGGAGLGVVDTAKRRLVRVIPLPGITGPHNLDLSADEKTAFVRDFVQHVAVVDLESGQVRRVITVGKGHGGIDVTPDGRYAATAAIADDFVTLIDTRSLAVRRIPVGKGSHGIRASRDSRWLYVTLTAEDAVAVIDLETGKVVKKIPTARFPFWVAVVGNP